MAQKKFTQLTAAGALDGTEVTAVVQSGTSKQTTAIAIAKTLYQAGYAFPGNALPTSWPVGGFGYATADRYSIGNPEYVPSGSLIFRISSGTSFSDFKFI